MTTKWESGDADALTDSGIEQDGERGMPLSPLIDQDYEQTGYIQQDAFGHEGIP